MKKRIKIAFAGFGITGLFIFQIVFCIGLWGSVIALFTSCGDSAQIEVRHPYTLDTWYLAEEVAIRERIECEFYLERSGDYREAVYTIDYTVKSGSVYVEDASGLTMDNRKTYPVAGIAGIDRTDPAK